MSWAPKNLSEILDHSGQHRAGSQDLPVLSITMKHGLIDQADKFKKRVASTDTSNYRIAYKNELVVGFPIDEGVLGFQTKYPAGIVSPAYDIWKIRTGVECHIPYLERYLRSPQARNLYASRMQGAVARRRSLTKADFLNLEIPFPTVNEQIGITHLLGKVEGLITRRKQHLQQFDDLLKSAFLGMFGDPVRNEKGWDTAPLEKLGSVNRGVSKHRPRNAPQLLGGKYPLIQTGEVSSAGTYINTYTHTYSDIGFAQSKQWKAGTLCITIAANIAKTGVLTFDACFPDSVVGFIAYENEASSLYVHGLFWFFQSILEKNAPAAAQKNINLEILRGLVVPKPPVSLQNQFAEVVGKIEALKSLYQQSLADLEALYSTLSQRAFRGELDLSRVPMPSDNTETKEPESQEPILIGTADTAITLPDIDGLLDFVQGPVRQQDILKYWLDAYRDQLGEATFSAQRFMPAAQIFLTDLFQDNDVELGNNDYEHIKTWLFAALEDGRLKQTRDITEHNEKGEPVFGNLVEIKYGALP